MTVRTAYEMTNKQLLWVFGQACFQAGVSNSGLVIDMMGPVYESAARYLNGVVLARLDGKSPPFSSGDIVQSKSGEAVRAVGYEGLFVVSEPHEIFRIHYLGNEKWLLELRDIPEATRGTPMFPAEEFVLVPASIPA